MERGQQWSRRDFLVRCIAGCVSTALLAACGGDRADPTPLPPAAPSPTEREAAMPTSTPPDDNSTPELEPLPQPVLLAVDAAAQEAGIAPGDVQILSFTQRAWPSTALGCPQPGFSYAQVVTPGYQIILQAGDQEYEFHSNMTSNVVLC